MHYNIYTWNKTSSFKRLSLYATLIYFKNISVRVYKIWMLGLSVDETVVSSENHRPGATTVPFF